MEMETIGYLKSLFDGVGGLKSLGEALDIGKKAKDLLKGSGSAPTAKEAELRELIVDLQDKMLDAREQSIELRRQLMLLLDEKERDISFESAKTEFERVEIAFATFAYCRKASQQHPSDSALYCAHCFEQSKRIATLALKSGSQSYSHLICAVCRNEYHRKGHSERRPTMARTDFNPHDF